MGLRRILFHKIIAFRWVLTVPTASFPNMTSIGKINKMLIIIDPTKLPMARSVPLLADAIAETASSGSEVPKVTKARPIKSSEILSADDNFSDSVTKVLVENSGRIIPKDSMSATSYIYSV